MLQAGAWRTWLHTLAGLCLWLARHWRSTEPSDTAERQDADGQGLGKLLQNKGMSTCLVIPLFQSSALEESMQGQWHPADSEHPGVLTW